MSKPITFNDEDTDSALFWAARYNETSPIKYKGKWFPTGTLRKLLDRELESTPTQPTGKENK